MKSRVVLLLALIGLLIFGNYAFGAERDTRDLSREKKIFQNYSGAGSNSVSSLCIEGYVFVIVAGDISNAISIVQVYEDKNGKVLPKSCEQ